MVDVDCEGGAATCDSVVDVDCEGGAGPCDSEGGAGPCDSVGDVCESDGEWDGEWGADDSWELVWKLKSLFLLNFLKSSGPVSGNRVNAARNPGLSNKSNAVLFSKCLLVFNVPLLRTPRRLTHGDSNSTVVACEDGISLSSSDSIIPDTTSFTWLSSSDFDSSNSFWDTSGKRK